MPPTHAIRVPSAFFFHVHIFEAQVNPHNPPTVAGIRRMLQLTVKTLSGEVQSFGGVDETSTVSVFSAVVATATGSPVGDFRLYRGATYLGKAKTLKAAGVVDDDHLTMSTRQDNQHRAQVRVDGLGGDARSSKYDFISAANEDVIDALAENNTDTKVVKDILMGREVPRAAGQSAKDRIKQLRLRKRLDDNEIGDLREEEGKRIIAEKHLAATRLIQVAEHADGAVQIAAGDLDTAEDVENKKVELAQQYKAS